MTAATQLSKAVASQKRAALEDAMAQQLTAVGIAFEREFRFHPVRRWRMDFWLPEHELAVEVEGGGFAEGRHTRGAGLEQDAEKYAEAICFGYRVLRVTGRHVKSGQALRWIERAEFLRKQQEALDREAGA